MVQVGSIPSAARRTALLRRAAVAFGLWLAAMVAAALISPPSAASAEQPNIVVVMSDDQPYYTVREMPFVSSLPGLQAFDVLYDNISLCCPARATFLSGLYSQHTGVEQNDGSRFDASSTLATWLQHGGYATGLFGKYLNGYPFGRGARYIPPGWDRWAAFAGREGPGYYDYSLNLNGRRRHFGHRRRVYSTDLLARRATDFVRTAPEPFFALVTPYGPHRPRTPAPRHRGLYDGVELGLRENFNRVANQAPRWYSELPRQHPGAQRTILREQLEALRAVDDLASKVVTAADERGDTVVVYLADNGYSLGSHRWSSKACGYEECGRIPGFIRGPGDPTDLLASIADLAPTLADVARVPHGPTDGRSLLPQMLGGNKDAERALLLRLKRTSETAFLPSFWGLRTERWKYLNHGRAAGRPSEELYDLQADPLELSNLATRRRWQPVLADMRARLREIRNAPPSR